MSDKVLLDNYLLLLKSTVEVYVHGTLESSNEDIRKILKESLDKTMDSQYKTYNKMTECGWYNVNNIKDNKICQTLNKIKNS